jgi:hypothetical protein
VIDLDRYPPPDLAIEVAYSSLGLEMVVLEEALRKSRSINHGKVSVWLLQQFGRGENEERS